MNIVVLVCCVYYKLMGIVVRSYVLLQISESYVTAVLCSSGKMNMVALTYVFINVVVVRVHETSMNIVAPLTCSFQIVASPCAIEGCHRTSM